MDCPFAHGLMGGRAWVTKCNMFGRKCCMGTIYTQLH